ncbi:MAG: hypothetical protein EU541_04055 [Promethearchaeota archaeon]|nr:MAG: hypothetical protein EU541_04055 [Candidatus Lokiarchaeota archaeon]
MPYSPPKKITVILSLLLLALGVSIIFAVIFGVFPEFLLDFNFTAAIEDVSDSQAWGFIGMIFVCLSWILFYLGITMRGI